MSGPDVERTPRPSGEGIRIPEREEVLTAPEGILAPHITDEAARRLLPGAWGDETHIERGTE